MKRLFTLLVFLLSAGIAQAQLFLDFGNDAVSTFTPGFVFGTFSNGTFDNSAADSAFTTGSGGNDSVMVAGSFGPALDLTSFASTDEIVIRGLKDGQGGTSTSTNAVLRLYSNSSFSEFAQWSFDLTNDFGTDFTVVNIGTIASGLSGATAGFDPSSVERFGFIGLDDSVSVWDFTIDSVTVIPEPSTYALFATGALVGLFLIRRRRLS